MLLSDGNQTVCQRQKNKSWPPIMPKQRERCLNIRKKGFLKNCQCHNSMLCAKGEDVCFVQKCHLSSSISIQFSFF
jgi:hypothetical protein